MKIISKYLLLGTLIVVVVIIAGCYDEISSNNQGQYKIAFASRKDRLGSAEIYSMNTDGTDKLRMTYNSADDYDPAAWSPDGNNIAFWSVRDENLLTCTTVLLLYFSEGWIFGWFDEFALLLIPAFVLASVNGRFLRN